MTRPKPGSVRIIGGKWRRRRIAVPASVAIRPTSDRVRETLFNWLMPYLPGATCLDLYAGTGALGFEAISRGAARATLIDINQAVIEHLRATKSLLDAHQIDIVQANANEWLNRTTPEPCDIIFLDPPFESGFLPSNLARIGPDWLKPHGWVYLEAAKIPILEIKNGGWQIQHSGRTRHVEFALVQRARSDQQVNPL